MLLKTLLAVLPPQYRAYITLGLRMCRNLNTAAERTAALDYFMTATESEGYMSVGEGSRFLSMLGLIGRPKSGPKARIMVAEEPVVSPTA